MTNENQLNSEAKQEPKKKRGRISRRGFLQIGAIALGGTVAAVYFGRSPVRRTLHQAMSDSENPGPHGISNFEADFVFEMLPDNRLQINVAKAEMGQGIVTGIAMMAAEELDVTYENVTVKMATSANGGQIDALGTGGSGTTRSLYVPLREMAATFREMLKMAAAVQWGVAVSQLSTADGFVSSDNNSMSYVDIVNSTSEWEMPETPELRPSSSFKVIGTEKPRIDLKPKVMGEAIFGLDQELPNMLHANVLKCPYIEGSLQSMDVAAAKAFPGVVDVVELDDLIAVVAENRYAAEMGKRKLNAQWDVPKVWQQADIDARVTVGAEGNRDPVNLKRNGDAIQRIEEDGGTTVTADYRVPIAVHAHMEPNSAIVDVREDSALVITATQAAGNVRNEVARATELNADNVEVQTAYLGGGFGRRYALNPAQDAARLSQHLNRPVQLVWDRETEFLCGVVRPISHHVLRAKLNDAGDLIAMEHELASGDQGLGLLPLPVPLLPILGADIISAAHGAAFYYTIENSEANITHVELPFLTSIWRGVGMVPNGFAIESFMDEVAHAANKDPFDLRLAHLPEGERGERWRGTLLRLREESGWDSAKPDGIGRGLAIIEDRVTVAAAVVEAEIVDGKILIRKVTSLIDPGLVVNPDGVRQQVEGCVMMGLSSALYEDNYVEDGQFYATNYHKYPMAMLSDTPEINVVMLESTGVPTGIGEPPIAPIAPAIANAIFDLTGQRLRSLPLQKALNAVSA